MKDGPVPFVRKADGVRADVLFLFVEVKKVGNFHVFRFLSRHRLMQKYYDSQGKQDDRLDEVENPGDLDQDKQEQ